MAVAWLRGLIQRLPAVLLSVPVVGVLTEFGFSTGHHLLESKGPSGDRLTG